MPQDTIHIKEDTYKSMHILTVNVLRTPLQRRGESAGVRDREKNSLLCVSGFSFKRLTGAQCRPCLPH